ILVLNGGSSTLKGMLCDADEPFPRRPPAPLWEAVAEWGRHAGTAQLRVKTRNQGEETTCEAELPFDAPPQVIGAMLRSLFDGRCQVIKAPGEVEAVGHRVVHGGKNLRQSVRITGEVQTEIARLGEFAPNHNPLAVAVMKAAEQMFGASTPQIAVFDTAFHAE